MQIITLDIPLVYGPFHMIFRRSAKPKPYSSADSQICYLWNVSEISTSQNLSLYPTVSQMDTDYFPAT
jgi:hypothetical protein